MSDNLAGGWGGGINNNWTGSISIASSDVSGNAAAGWGGGINNNDLGTLTVLNSTVSNNSSQGWGGGINNNYGGPAAITLTTISGNSADNGGGINNNDAGALTLDRSTVAGNAATDTSGFGGGGILNNWTGSVTLTATTVSGNTGAGDGGGGINNNGSGTVTLTNCTISGNLTTGSEGGGGIYDNGSAGAVVLDFVTLAGNGATTGGRSLHVNNVRGGFGVFSLRNTIVANPSSGSNCSGTLLSNGNNLASDASCALSAAGDLENTNPLLGALAANGGPTETHGLQAGSPALDAADATGAPATDQRGVARPVGAGFDIGAFEGTVGGGPTPTLSIDSVTADEGDAGTTTFTFTVTLSAASTQAVTVDFATADGTATAGSDYTAVNGTLTFAPGVVTQPAVVSVLGDTAIEADESVLRRLVESDQRDDRRPAGHRNDRQRRCGGRRADPNPVGVGPAPPGAAARRPRRHPDPRAALALEDRAARVADRPPRAWSTGR